MKTTSSIPCTLLAFLILGKALCAQEVAAPPVPFDEWFQARVATVAHKADAQSEQKISTDTQLTANGKGTDRQASSLP